MQIQLDGIGAIAIACFTVALRASLHVDLSTSLNRSRIRRNGVGLLDFGSRRHPLYRSRRFFGAANAQQAKRNRSNNRKANNVPDSRSATITK